LRSIAETIIMDSMYEMPSGLQDKLCITLDYARTKVETLTHSHLICA